MNAWATADRAVATGSLRRGVAGLLCLLCLAYPVTAHAQAARIVVDGLPPDWEPLSPIHTDPAGDATPDAVDFSSLWCANDERTLFLRVQVGAEINLQVGNRITLYFDTDDNPATGIPVGDMGAELRWTFGERAGVFATAAGATSIRHGAVGLVSAPTVSSNEFEIAIDRHARPDGVTALFTADTIRIVITDGHGDVLPDAGSVRYAFDAAPLPPIEPLTIQKSDESHLRILSYNVSFDGPFDPKRQEPYTRLLRAIGPEVIGFQEMYDHSGAETLRLVESMLPVGPGQQWHAAKVPPDIVVVSRFRVVSSFNIFDTGNGAFLLDMRPHYDSDLLVIVAHPPCCEANAARQREIDAIMAFVRDAKERGGQITLVPGTPILLMGDFNLVGLAQQFRTLVTGEIVNAQYGPPFPPDWDETDLGDAMPRHPERLVTYTWRDVASEYPPGRLDVILYTDAVIGPANGFALFTGDMSDDLLATHGLLRTDTEVASDHVPLVQDFVMRVATSPERHRR